MPPVSEPSSQWVATAATQPGSVLLANARPDAESHASYLFADPVELLAAENLSEIPDLFSKIELELAAGRYAAGFISYEAGYHFEPSTLPPAANLPAFDLPLAWFGVYNKPQVLEGFHRSLSSPKIGAMPEFHVGISRSDYCESVERIRQFIAAGDLYQANFTVPLRIPWSHDGARLFERMLANQPVPYGALLNLGAAKIVSASPELFFRRAGNRILVRPMKGTWARGRDCAEDTRNAASLAGDEKNRAENVMIVDLLRSDLGRICSAGSVHATNMFQVERYPGLLQMTSTVCGELRSGISQYDIFRALFPCGSITGAPKVRTMQVIRELEEAPRGIACGAIGYFSPNGDAVFSVAIRTATLRNGEVRMRVGSGVTYDSDPDAEFHECLLKAQFLIRGHEPFELIETLRWNGDFFLLKEHLDRLEASAAYFDVALDRELVRSELQKFARALDPAQCHRVRLLMARSGEVSIQSHPITLDRRWAAIVVAPERTDPSDPFLRHKTTRRALYDHALAKARAAGFDDALFLNSAGIVTECSIHNLLVLRRDEILTPALDCGLLPGIYRRYLLERHPGIREAELTMDDLVSADRVYILNSVRGMRRVEKIVPYLAHADSTG